MSIEDTLTNYENKIVEIYTSLQNTGLFGNNPITIHPRKILYNMYFTNNICHNTYLILNKDITEKEKIKLLKKIKGPSNKYIIKTTKKALDIIHNKGPRFCEFYQRLYTFIQKKRQQRDKALLNFVQSGGSTSKESGEKAEMTMKDIRREIESKFNEEIINLNNNFSSKKFLELLKMSDKFFPKDPEKVNENLEKFIPWIFPLMTVEKKPLWGWMMTPPLDFVGVLLNVANLILKFIWPWINKFISTLVTAGTSAISETIPIVGPFLTGSLYTIVLEPIIGRLGENLVQIIALFFWWSRGPEYFDHVYSIVLEVVPELIELSIILTDYLTPIRKYLDIIEPVVDDISLVMKCPANILNSIMENPGLFLPNKDGNIDSDKIIRIIENNKACLPIPQDILEDTEALTEAISDNLTKIVSCLKNLNKAEPDTECITSILRTIIEGVREKMTEKS